MIHLWCSLQGMQAKQNDWDMTPTFTNAPHDIVIQHCCIIACTTVTTSDRPMQHDRLNCGPNNRTWVGGLWLGLAKQQLSCVSMWTTGCPNAVHLRNKKNKLPLTNRIAFLLASNIDSVWWWCVFIWTWCVLWWCVFVSIISSRSKGFSKKRWF